MTVPRNRMLPMMAIAMIPSRLFRPFASELCELARTGGCWWSPNALVLLLVAAGSWLLLGFNVVDDGPPCECWWWWWWWWCGLSVDEANGAPLPLLVVAVDVFGVESAGWPDTLIEFVVASGLES